MGVAVGDRVKVDWVGRCFGQRIILTHWYRVITGSGPGTTYLQDMTALLTALDVGGLFDMTTVYLDALALEYRLTEMRAQVVAPVRLAYVPLVLLRPGTGDTATVANDSAALTMRTANAGRNQVATKHIGPIADGASVDGLITAEYRAKINQIGLGMLQEVEPVPGGAGYRPIIQHRATGLYSDLASFIVGDQSRVQRRRTVGVGV